MSKSGILKVYFDTFSSKSGHGTTFTNDYVQSCSIDFRRCSFNGKERDAETGYSYFGARYYSSDLSVWLSIDPMAAKYPSLSPYTYCANNPMRVVDPNGEVIEPAGEEEKALYKKYKKIVLNKVSYWQNKVKLRETQINNAKTKIGETIRKKQYDLALNSLSDYSQIINEWTEMENSPIVFKLRMNNNIQVPLLSCGSTTYNITNKEVDINIGTSSFFNQIQILSHELLHGFQYLKGELDFSQTGLTGGLFYDKTDEIAAYRRGNMFGDTIDPIKHVNSCYNKLDSQRKSYHLLSPNEKKQYDAAKSKGKYW